MRCISRTNNSARPYKSVLEIRASRLFELLVERFVQAEQDRSQRQRLQFSRLTRRLYSRIWNLETLDFESREATSGLPIQDHCARVCARGRSFLLAILTHNKIREFGAIYPGKPR